MGCGGRMCYCCSCRESDATSSPRVEVVHHPSNGERMLNGNANGNGEVLRKDEGGNAQLVPLKSNLKRPSRLSEENGVGERYNTSPTPMDGIGVTTSSVNGTGDVANTVEGIRVEANTTKPMDGNKERVGAIEEHSVEAKQEDFHANGRRKVQWTDAHGQELAQVKEFELSDSNHSDDEGRGNSDDSCTCVIQ